EGGYLGTGGQEFVADLAFGLEAAEFGSGAAQGVVGAGAGAVDGVLQGAMPGILHRIDRGVTDTIGHTRLDDGAATETPSRANDFRDEGLLERAAGLEMLPEAFAELVVRVGFVGADEILHGE